LAESGAISFWKYGEGDDFSSLEFDFEKWQEGIWDSLKQAFTD